MTEAKLATLYRRRPRSRFVRVSLGLFALLIAISWSSSHFDLAQVFSARRAASLQRFLEQMRPLPLRDRVWDWGEAWRWASDIMAREGWSAVGATLAISLLAIELAGLASSLLALAAARNLASHDALAPAGRPPRAGQRLFWMVFVGAARLLLIGLRALPEYVWAFLAVALLGTTAWPAVLALALHNTGILGRLGAETIEDMPHRDLTALRALGARRRQIAAVGILPAILPRFLLYFFYRWETCVREATVLGMLGVVSLGYWIADARSRGQEDRFVFLILLGSLLVVAGDLVSAMARGIVRRG